MINPLNRQELSALAAFTAQIHKVIHSSFSGIQLYLLTWDLKWDKLKKKLHAFSMKDGHEGFWEIKWSWLSNLVSQHRKWDVPPWVWHLHPSVSVWGPGIHCYWTLSCQEDEEGPSRWTCWIPYLRELQLFISSSSFHPKSVSLTIDWIHLFLDKVSYLCFQYDGGKIYFFWSGSSVPQGKQIDVGIWRERTSDTGI